MVMQDGHPVMPTNASDPGISDGLWQLLHRCWNANCTERHKIDEIHQHLCQEPARGLVFPPSRLSLSLRAHSPAANLFLTPDAQTPIEGMSEIALWTTGSSVYVIRMSPVTHARESHGY